MKEVLKIIGPYIPFIFVVILYIIVTVYCEFQDYKRTGEEE